MGNKADSLDIQGHEEKAKRRQEKLEKDQHDLEEKSIQFDRGQWYYNIAIFLFNGPNEWKIFCSGPFSVLRRTISIIPGIQTTTHREESWKYHEDRFLFQIRHEKWGEP